MIPPGKICVIVEGVRRSVAARNAGLSTVTAVAQADDGKLGPPFDVPLAELYSTKASVRRTGDNGRYLRIEAGMTDPVARSGIPAIVVRFLPARTAKYFSRLESVVLDP